MIISKENIRLSGATQVAGMRALTVLDALKGLPNHASRLQYAIVAALEDAGFTVLTEVRASHPDSDRGGRVDILAAYGAGRVAIELDARTARRKSVEKLCRFQAFRIIGLRGAIMERPKGIDAVVMLHVDD